MKHRSDVVAVIQPFVPGYRRPLFDAIDDELRNHGLKLEVWHDFPKGRVAARGNADEGRWSVPIRQHRVSVGRRNLTYRSVHRGARQVRAVIAGLASTNAETYALAVDPAINLMLWGHGKNFTASNNRVDAALESWLTRRATHVFTYTEQGKEHVVEQGAPADKVTVVVNTTDTRTLREARERMTSRDAAEIRRRHGFGDSRIALFVGAFDGPKQLPFLIEAMDRVVESVPGVTLVLAGAGPDELELRKFARARQHVRMIGRLEGVEFAELAAVTDLVVMPGRVGLVAVDALALGLPIATTRYPFHAPEAAYLEDGVDSLWTEFDLASYSDGVAALLKDAQRLAALAAGARAKGESFSVEASARRFVDGVLKGIDA